ncbi:MAG: hypothetical protein BGN85_11565 [Alphaproteobacteria bacterium 64-11]|nr:polysaccharide deacetylase family protein [Alphaproteobacteria bacterium]OJU08128.1 MAG: hypothetical protein BGN85_11565 [Alphaproteobacteria bacterium 64-11]
MRKGLTFNIAGVLGPRAGAWFGAQRISDLWPQGVVSFTFDDFPKSAFAVGGDILERHGARGTYYTALKLAGIENDLGRSFDESDVLAAHQKGHEIACHTHTHINCAQSSLSTIKQEIRANAQDFSGLVAGATLENFAYPYGAVSPRAKQSLKWRFQSCRGIRPGVNKDVPALAELLANRIYAQEFDGEKISDLIAQNKAEKSWLIFYTHDVTDDPSPYGCTPGQFETVVSEATKSSPIRLVRDVIASLRGMGN